MIYIQKTKKSCKFLKYIISSILQRGPMKARSETRGRGRPAGLDGLDIDRTIAELFIQGASPGFIIQKTGFDKNTVYPKYNALLAIAKEEDEKDFRERYEQKKDQFVRSMENLIDRTYTVLNYTELRMGRYTAKEKDIPEFLMQKFIELVKTIVMMQKEKAAKDMKLPLAKEIENAITEEVENHGN